MSEIRVRTIKESQLKESYRESIQPIQAQIGKRFRRLKLKEEPIEETDPVADIGIYTFKRHLRELFPKMDLGKIQKVHTNKVQAYVTWKEAHCQERQYTFQIRKCQDSRCCVPPLLPETTLQWISDPVLSEDDQQYKPYQEVKGLHTTENDRPTHVAEPPPPSQSVERGKNARPLLQI